MRFCVFTWHFHAPCSEVALWWPCLDILGCVVRHLWNRTSQIRRPWFIAANRAFARRWTQEISCFYVTFSDNVLRGSLVMTMSRHSWKCCMWCLKSRYATTSSLIRCRQSRIRTTSHSWDFVLLHGISFVCINVIFDEFWLSTSWQIHMSWQWLCDRICVGYLCGLQSGISVWLQEFGGCWENKTSEMSSPCINVIFDDDWLPTSSQIHMWWQWLCDRICVGYLCGLQSGISLWLQEFCGSWEHKTTDMSSHPVRVYKRDF